MNENNDNNEKVQELDNNAKDIIKRAVNEKQLPDEQQKKLLKEIEENFDFDKIMSDLEQKYSLDMDKYVIFTNGKEQLYYENGEFFVISTTDSKKNRVKIKRDEARNMYNEYLLITILNPMLKQKIKSGKIAPNTIKEVEDNKLKKQTKTKAKTKEKIKDSLKKSVKEQVIEDVDKEDKEVKERLESLKQKEKELKKKKKEKQLKQEQEQEINK